MEDNFVKGTISVNASPTKVWDVLTNPDKIMLYTASATQTDWRVGSSISWTGEMHGVKYENKGQVLRVEPNTMLMYTYWSGMGGDTDAPENYSDVTYTIRILGEQTVELTYLREKIATAIETQIFQGHIQTMLEEIKRLAEE